MGKRKSSNRNSNIPKRQRRYVGRDYFTPIARPLPRQTTIQNFDNRYFSFPITTLPKHPLTRYGARAAIQPVVKKGRNLHETFKIVAPKKTLICIRRKTRREVLFATGRGGKRHGTRKVHRNYTSSYSC